MMQNLDRFAEGWWQWQAGVFFQVAVLVGLVAVVDLAIRRWAWPRLRHALWLLVLLKLLLPPSLTSPVSLLGHFRQEADAPKPVVTVQAAAPIRAVPAPAAPKPEPGPPVAAGMPPAVVPAARTPLSWQAGLLCLWALGVAGLALWLLVRLRRFRRELALAASSEPPPEWLDRVTRQVASQLKLRRIPPVQFSHATQSPAVFGLFRPVVLLPATGDLTETEARHVLLHELAHIKRGDLVLHALHLTLLVLYWHNPLLWLSRRFFQNLRELCCDATVANALRQEVPACRQTLLVSAQRLLAQPTVPGLGLLGWSESGHWLGVRLKWLERNTWKRRWLQIVTTVCLVLIVAGCVLPMGRRASEYDTLGVVTFPKATPEAKHVLDLYAAHREQAPLRYALACRTERDLTVTFRDGDRFYEAIYSFGVDAGGRRPDAEAVAADSKRAGQTLESMLAWTADRAPVYLRLSDGRYSRVCHADGFGGLTNEPKDAVLGSYDLRTMLKSAKTLRSLGWPEPLIAPDALQVRLVSDDPYALDHGLVCLEFAFPPSPQESGRQGSKVTARPWTSRYYLDPQKGYVCRRQQAWPSGYLAEITAFTSMGNGGFLPATVVEVGSLYASEPTSGWKESITSIVCTLDPIFPDGIFDPDALESRYTMRYPRADRVTGRKTVLRWRSLAEVNGTVLDGDTGEPIADALVRVVSPSPGTRSIWDGSKAGSAVVETRSDGTGGFTLHVPVERNGNGSLAADARMPGFSSVSRYWSDGLGWVSANQGSVLDLSIRLRRAKYVAGVVVDASGQPLANARVSANLVGGEGESGIRGTRTDAEGRFEIFDFPLRPPALGQKGRLLIEHPEARASIVEDIYQLDDRSLASLTIKMDPGLRLGGTLLRADGTPATGTNVKVGQDNGRLLRETTTDTAGHFQVRGLGPDAVVVYAHGDQLRERCVLPVSLTDHDQEVEVRMLLASAPVGLKTVDLLGLRVADLTPELAAVYALGVPDGVVILDPGQAPERLGIGVLAEGHCFNRVGHERIHNTRELVARILADAHAPWGDSGAPNPVRLTFVKGRWEQGGGWVTFTEADLAALKALSQEFDGAEKQ